MPIINDSLSSSANATSSVKLGLTVIGCGCGLAAAVAIAGWTVTLSSSANGTSSVTPTSWAGCSGRANATSSVLLGSSASLGSSAAASSRMFVVLPSTATGSANATSAAKWVYSDWALSSSANATSATSYAYTSSFKAVASAVASASVVYGGFELGSGTANGTAAVAFSRSILAQCVTSANATSGVGESSAIPNFVLTGTAVGSSTVSLTYTSRVTASASAQGDSSVYYNDPAFKAWVMNTETGAPFWYDNYNFESMTQLPDGRVLAASSNGIFTITRGTDAGTPITYRLVTGFMDFKSPAVKRMDNLYLSQTNATGITILPEVQETGPAASALIVEPHSASLPRNSRVMFPKGLWGRHWRFTITGVGEFQINDMTMDVAFSTRRL
jgi:hypothetical protein